MSRQTRPELQQAVSILERKLAEADAELDLLRSRLEPLEPCDAKDFRQIAENLRALCPPPKGCTVEIVRLPHEDMTEGYGFCSKKGRKFRIEVDEKLSRGHAEWALIHEYAHVLAWKPYHPLSADHDASFGVMWALVHSKYYGVT